MFLRLNNIIFCKEIFQQNFSYLVIYLKIKNNFNFDKFEDNKRESS